MALNFEALRTAKLRTVILPIAALLPFFLSLAFHALGPVATEAAKDTARAALAFEQYSINFGDRPVEPGRFVFARFGFENNSDRTATVTALQPSCGCLSPQLDKRTFRTGDKQAYRPGQTGEFFLRVQTANEQPGPHEYFVKLLYEDPKPREVTLTLKVVLPKEKVAVQPKSLIFYQLGTTPTTQTITVTDFRTRPLDVTGVQSSSELVTAELDTVDRDGQGNRRADVSVTVVGDVPPGRHRALITILTSDPDHDKLQVPLLIQGPSRTQNVVRDTGPAQPQRR